MTAAVFTAEQSVPGSPITPRQLEFAAESGVAPSGVMAPSPAKTDPAGADALSVRPCVRPLIRWIVRPSGRSLVHLSWRRPLRGSTAWPDAGCRAGRLGEGDAGGASGRWRSGRNERLMWCPQG